MFQHNTCCVELNSWLTVSFGAIMRNQNKKLDKYSKRFKSFLRLMLESTARLAVNGAQVERFSFS